MPSEETSRPTPGGIDRDLMTTLRLLRRRSTDIAELPPILDENGLSSGFATLLQHAALSQDLSRELLRLTTEIQQDLQTTTVGTHMLGSLSAATSMSAHAAASFAESAECSLTLKTDTAQVVADEAKHVISNHAVARAYLRTTSRLIRNAATQLQDLLTTPAASARTRTAPPTTPSASAPRRQR
ncbi:hypothetical protein [Streptomyces sp. GZWMJZ-114]|uniref:hypothetical protein n=1 Tax=Streptomyces sp. GZWMJZ-114 TaxID=2494734 RepID=UPI0010118962|nr:hypothetical protein [Streptomyces sp. GZWMJZ-114]